MRRYENVKIGDLKPYKNNARTHDDEQVEKIANSIKELGFINPVLIILIPFNLAKENIKNLLNACRFLPIVNIRLLCQPKILFC